MKWVIALCLSGLSITASAQANYSNPHYALSFRYTTGYVLKEGALDDKDGGLGYLGPIPMEFAAPGGVRVVTVEVPAGSYPGTDFVSAFFTASIYPHLTNDQCERFADKDAPAYGNVPPKQLSGTIFTGFRSALRVQAINSPECITTATPEAPVMNSDTEWPQPVMELLMA
jgi:hypothetical protein